MALNPYPRDLGFLCGWDYRCESLVPHTMPFYARDTLGFWCLLGSWNHPLSDSREQLYIYTHMCTSMYMCARVRVGALTQRLIFPLASTSCQCCPSNSSSLASCSLYQFHFFLHKEEPAPPCVLRDLSPVLQGVTSGLLRQ
jgi:hypothetical protein